MTEADAPELLRSLPLHPGALGLRDDAARLGDLVITKDLIVEGVHFLPDDPPGDVAWKLVATNLSDLAAKGAVPEGVLLGMPLGDDAWDRAFVDGLREVLDALRLPAARRRHGVAAGGPSRSPRSAAPPPRRRAAARGAGDALWVTGTIGDAGAGLAIARGADGPAGAARALSPPDAAPGRGSARSPPIVTAMMDVSDGLLIDAGRMAAASGCAVTIDLGAVPLSADYVAWSGDRLRRRDRGRRLRTAVRAARRRRRRRSPPRASARFAAGAGLTLTDAGVRSRCRRGSATSTAESRALERRLALPAPALYPLPPTADAGPQSRTSRRHFERQGKISL